MIKFVLNLSEPSIQLLVTKKSEFESSSEHFNNIVYIFYMMFVASLFVCWIAVSSKEGLERQFLYKKSFFAQKYEQHLIRSCLGRLIITSTKGSE